MNLTETYLYLSCEYLIGVNNVCNRDDFTFFYFLLFLSLYVTILYVRVSFSRHFEIKYKSKRLPLETKRTLQTWF